jgi:DNA-binding response OmpR family regulator
MSTLAMIIDDSLTVRKILEVTLRREEFDVVSFADGLEALHALKAKTDLVPAVIFVDILLPGMDGYALIRLLRTNARFDSTIIIILSRRDGVMDRLKGRMAGATVYMTKPFKTQDIVSVLAQCLSVELPSRGDLYRATLPNSKVGDVLSLPFLTLPYKREPFQKKDTGSLERPA